MSVGGYILIFVIICYFGIVIYIHTDHGYWTVNPNPDPEAKVIGVNSTFHKGSIFVRGFETTVDFSDGYFFKTRKNKQRSYDPQFKTPTTIGTEYYIDYDLKAEIIEKAVEAHKKAVEKKLRKKS